MAGIVQITPFVFTQSLAGSLDFFQNILGFSCGFQMENYAFIERDNQALRLLETDASCAIGEQMIYLDTDDADALFASLTDKLDTLPAERVRAPFDQPYGMREFHVKDPDNCLLMFGTDIPPSA